MCLIVLAWRVHPDYPLVVAANRDEFFARPASPAHWWTDHPDLLAGRDLEAGGTWMGVSRSGRFAALTNYRDPTLHRPGAPSRGLLVRDCLAATDDATVTLERIAASGVDYAPFNLFAGDGRQLAIHESTTGRVRTLDAGIYALSNRLLDTPWPKVEAARTRFTAALPALPDESAFLSLLSDRTPAPDDQLPDTGVGREWERHLSSAFIRAPGYGTRCSSLITFARNGGIRFTEWTWNETGELASEVRHRLVAPR